MYVLQSLQGHSFGYYVFVPDLQGSSDSAFFSWAGPSSQILGPRKPNNFVTIINTFNCSCWEIKLVSYIIIQRLAQWENLLQPPWTRLGYFCGVLRQNFLFAVILQIKKSCHGRLREDMFHIPNLSCGLILYREISILEGRRKA